jgi:photosystem II stability/assembly factor-like uncharacterized protein
VTAVAVDPLSSAVYAAFEGQGIFRSADGLRWSRAGLDGMTVMAIAVADDGTVYAGCNPGDLFVSKDGGQTWSDTGIGYVNGIALGRQKPNALYVATSGGTYASFDQGTKWNLVDDRLAFALAASAGSVTTLYVGTQAEGVVRGDDAGGPRMASSAGMRAAITFSLAADASRPGRLYAGSRGGWWFTSDDHGASWHGAHDDFWGDVESIVVDPSNPATIFVSAGTIAKSIDSGRTWKRPPLPPESSVRTLAIDPVAPVNLFAGMQAGLLRSTDGGETWTVSSLTDAWVSAIATDVRSPGRVYANSSRGFFRSSDGGATWVAAGAGLPAVLDSHPMLVSPADSVVYVGGNTGLYRSTDQGTTFSLITDKKSNVYVLAMSMDPREPRVIYATTPEGVMQTIDSGQNWRTIDVGLPPSSQIRALLMDPFDPSLLYGATYGMSVYRSCATGQ